MRLRDIILKKLAGVRKAVMRQRTAGSNDLTTFDHFIRAGLSNLKLRTLTAHASEISPQGTRSSLLNSHFNDDLTLCDSEIADLGENGEKQFSIPDSQLSAGLRKKTPSQRAAPPCNFQSSADMPDRSSDVTSHFSLLTSQFADDLTLLESEIGDFAVVEPAETAGKEMISTALPDQNADFVSHSSGGRGAVSERSTLGTGTSARFHRSPLADAMSDTRERRVETPSDFADELSLPYSEIGDLFGKETGQPDFSESRKRTLPSTSVVSTGEATFSHLGSNCWGSQAHPNLQSDEFDELTVTDAEITDLNRNGYEKNTDADPAEMRQGAPHFSPLADARRSDSSGKDEIVELTNEDRYVADADGEPPPEPENPPLISAVISAGKDAEIIELTDGDALVADEGENTVNDFDEKDNILSESQDQIVELLDTISEFEESGDRSQEETLPEHGAKRTEKETFVLGVYEDEDGAGAKTSALSQDIDEGIEEGQICFKLGSDIMTDSSDNYEDTYQEAFRETQASHIEELLDNMTFGDESDLGMILDDEPPDYRLRPPENVSDCAHTDCAHTAKPGVAAPCSTALTLQSRESPCERSRSQGDSEEQDLLDLLKMELEQPDPIEQEVEGLLNETSDSAKLMLADARGSAGSSSELRASASSAGIGKKQFGIDVVLKRTADKMLEHISRIVMNERIISKAIERAVRNRSGKKIEN